MHDQATTLYRKNVNAVHSVYESTGGNNQQTGQKGQAESKQQADLEVGQSKVLLDGLCQQEVQRDRHRR